MKTFAFIPLLLICAGCHFGMGSIPRGSINYQAVQEQRDHDEQIRQRDAYREAMQKEYGK